MPTAYSSDFKIHKGFLTRRYDWQYDANISLRQEQLASLFSELVKNLNSTFKIDSIIKNVKGRDSQNLINLQTQIPYDHELLFAQFKWKPESFGINRDGDKQEKSCGFHLISPFDHFQGNDIFHRVARAISGEAPPEISLESISSHQGINLQSFRLGLDFYGQSAFANWFISAPVVLESIIIEANPNETKLRLQSDGHKQANELAYDEQGMISTLFKTIASILEIDLEADLKSKLSK